MRIQHNMMAINANRNLGNNNSALAKTLEKLSSGYKINRAGDNAAGLAISEKMRAQITCLGQAETNCNDGVSLIQTAEGALQEVHSMLNRLTELCEQSANGTYDDAVDRASLQSEVKQLVSEIDRISSATNFNGITLLDGKLGGYALQQVASAAFTDVKATGGKADLGSVLALNIPAAPATNVTIATCGPTAANSGAIGNWLKVDATYNEALKQYTIKLTKDPTNNGATNPTPTDFQTQCMNMFDGMTLVVDATGTAGTCAMTFGVDTTGDGNPDTIGKGLQLQIGDTADDYNQLTIAVKDMSASGMKYTDPAGNTMSVADIDISTLDGAVAGMAVAKNAINYVSSQRGTLGAMQNRLEHTINNLSTTNENITNAESRIRDTDMAAEMMTYTSKSILSQAAQSMLAQANQVPQQVLSLLQ